MTLTIRLCDGRILETQEGKNSVVLMLNKTVRRASVREAALVNDQYKKIRA